MKRELKLILIICIISLYACKSPQDDELISMLDLAKGIRDRSVDIDIYNEYWLKVCGEGKDEDVIYITRKKYHIKHGKEVYYFIDIHSDFGYFDDDDENKRIYLSKLDNTQP